MAKKAVVSIKKTAHMSEAEIISAEGLDLQFGNRSRQSPYSELLEKLLDAGKDSVLRISNPKARYSVTKAARRANWKVEFAERDGVLYVRIAGVATAPRLPYESTAERAILVALGSGPLSVREIARRTKADPAACDAVLAKLVKAAAIEGEDNIYRLVARKGAA